MKKEDIKKILVENKEILKKYNVKSIALFGSYVREEQREDSDIDLLVEFERDAFGKDFDGYTDNYENLKSFLENTLDKTVELLTNEMISPYIKPYVLKEAEYC
ncbi:MAG: nucleotidyltransferase family protein [Ignavibacteriales bacterium]